MLQEMISPAEPSHCVSGYLLLQAKLKSGTETELSVGQASGAMALKEA